MDREILELYTDYLISSFGPTTATGLSALLGGPISHDRISRFLNTEDFTSADLWHLVKPLARQIQSEEAVLIVDDTVEPKPYTDESELVCWHWDHSEERAIKGINLLSALYYSQEVCLPVAFELITKPLWVTNKKTGKRKRAAQISKQERFRRLVQACVHNKLPFRYVLADSWFSADENMLFIKQTLKKDFILPLKENRLLATSEEAKLRGEWSSLSDLSLEADTPVLIWLPGVPFALLLCKQVFTNKDASQGVLYLVTSDTTLSAEQMQTLYQKRWKVEVYHKSIKSNLGFAKSPTKTTRTQSNHFFACLWAYVKMERLRMSTHLNHFAFKAKLYHAALASAFQQLQEIKAAYCPAA